MNGNLRKSFLFIGLTYSLSWLITVLFFIMGGTWNTPEALAIAVVYMFVPMTMAVVVQKFVYREPLKEPLGISWKLNPWFLVAWLLPPLIAFGTLGMSLLFPGIDYSPDMAGMIERFRSVLTPEQLRQLEAQIAASPIHPVWLSLLQGLLAGITINAVAGFGEELGWRGLLQRELSFLGFWKSSAAIGVIWGIWHAPLILQGHNYPQHPIAGVLMMTMFTVLLAPIFSYVRLQARSVIAAAIIHGSLNATAGLAILTVQGGSDLTVGVTGFAGFIVLALVNVAIFIYDRSFAKEPVLRASRSV